MEGRKLLALLVGVCILSAGIGTGITLLAQTGPEGPQGEAGPAGPRGPRGYDASEEEGELALSYAQDLEGRVDDLEAEVEELWEEQGYDESQIAELGGQLTEVTQGVSSLCIEFGC